MRGLGLKSETEWRAYCKSGKKPDDIPANPNQTYAKLAGPEWATGSGLARSPPRCDNIDLSRKPARSCAASV